MDWLPKNNSKPSGHWNTKENIIEEAKKYTKLKDFQKHSGGAFHAARRLGIIGELTWLEKETRLPHSYWKDKERVMEEAKKYTSKIAFQKGNQSAYWAALKYGYLEEMPWLVKRKVTPRGILTNKELIIEESKKYKTRGEFERKNKSLYSAACRYRYIDEMTWLAPVTKHPKGYWDDINNVIKEAQKYNSREEIKQKNTYLYKIMFKKGYVDKLDWLK